MSLNTTNALIFKQNSVEIMALSGTFNAILNESHESELQTTRYTIETGAVLSDQAALMPKKITLECYVSSLEIASGSSLQTVYRDKEAWQQIMNFQSEFELTTVNTLLGVYDNMLLKKATTRKTRDIALGNLIGTLEFEQQLIADTQFTRLPKNRLKSPAANNSSTIARGDVQSETRVASTILDKGIHFVF